GERGIPRDGDPDEHVLRVGQSVPGLYGERHPDTLVGVCTLSPDDPASPAILERFVRESNVRGLRSIPAKSGRLHDPGVEALWAAAERLGIVVNALINRERPASWRPSRAGMARCAW